MKYTQIPARDVTPKWKIRKIQFGIQIVVLTNWVDF